MAITFNEFQKIEGIVEQKVTPLRIDVGILKEQMGSMLKNIDEFLRIVRVHDQEWLILRKQHEKIRGALVNKKIAADDELSII